MSRDVGNTNVAFSMGIQVDFDNPENASDSVGIRQSSMKAADIELNDIPSKSPDDIILYPTESSTAIIDDQSSDDFNPPSNPFTKAIDDMDKAVTAFCHKHSTVLISIICTVLMVAYLVYFGFALFYDVWRAKALWIGTLVAVLFTLYKFIQHYWGDLIYKSTCGLPVGHVKKYWKVWKWIVPLVLIALLIGFAAWMGVFKTLHDHPQQLKSAFGLVVFILFSWLCSKRPGRVQWKTVFWGVGLQIFLGIFIIRTTAGFETFTILGDGIDTFLAYTDVGTEFVVGKPLEVHFFLFKVLPVIIFCSYVIGLLQYIGVMQWIIRVCAWVMQYTMEVSGIEALCAAANIFVGMTTAPIMVKPYLKDLTSSELHSVIVGGFATIAGSVLGAYISFGISASHLLSASVISAPAALAVAKLFYPETQKPKTMFTDEIVIAESPEKNVLEAMVNAATDGFKISAAIVAQIIAILALLAFIDAALAWLGSLINYPELTFTFLCRYVLYPVAWLMGVDNEDIFIVAELVGTKTFANEFVAYGHLAEYINNRETGEGPTLSVRSEVIATYALCGFSNLGSIGLFIGSFGPLMPDRKGEVAVLCIRGLIAGTVACCMTACIAGILYDEGPRLFGGSELLEATTLS
ncbi:solute carrier family 28 member 3-like [Glandiceps talaboti]